MSTKKEIREAIAAYNRLAARDPQIIRAFQMAAEAWPKGDHTISGSLALELYKAGLMTARRELTGLGYEVSQNLKGRR